jgi:hypothetical protein
VNTLSCGTAQPQLPRERLFRRADSAPHELAVSVYSGCAGRRKTHSGVANTRDEHVELPELHRNNPAFAEDRRAVPDEALAA